MQKLSTKQKLITIKKGTNIARNIKPISLKWKILSKNLNSKGIKFNFNTPIQVPENAIEAIFTININGKNHTMNCDIYSKIYLLNTDNLHKKIP